MFFLFDTQLNFDDLHHYNPSVRLYFRHTYKKYSISMFFFTFADLNIDPK